MSLASGVTDLATRIAAYLKGSVLPRLLPPGGSANQVLTKASAADYAAGWTSTPQDVGFFCTGKPLASEVLGLFVVPRAFTLPKDLVGSSAIARGPATADATLVIFRESGIGTGAVMAQAGAVIFPAGSFVGAMYFPEAITFAPTDRIILAAPPTVDATLADFAVTLVGSR